MIGLEGGLRPIYLSGPVTIDQYTLELAIAYVAMVFIGGLDSIAGAVIGAAIVTSLPTLAPQILSGVLDPQTVSTDGAAIGSIIYGLLVVVFIVSSPAGLVGLAHRTARSRIASIGLDHAGQIWHRIARTGPPPPDATSADAASEHGSRSEDPPS